MSVRSNFKSWQYNFWRIANKHVPDSEEIPEGQRHEYISAVNPAGKRKYTMNQQKFLCIQIKNKKSKNNPKIEPKRKSAMSVMKCLTGLPHPKMDKQEYWKRFEAGEPIPAELAIKYGLTETLTL